MKKKERRSPILVLICVVFAILSIAYALVTDPKGGPDETAHFIYIRSLATDHCLPEIASRTGTSLDTKASHEGHQPPLYYAVMAVPYAILHAMGASVATIWHVLRVLGIVFGVVWLCSVYHLARGVLKTERSALAVTAFVALIPTGAYMAGVLNNDTMISMWFGWALVQVVQFLREGALDRKRSIWLGLLIGLAVLTKAQGMLLVPVLLLAGIVAALYGRPGSIRPAAMAVGTALLAAAVVGGWWLARSLVVHGSLQAQSLSHPLLPNGIADIYGNWGEFLRFSRAVCVDTYGYFWTPFWLVRPFLNASLYTNVLLVLSALPVIGFLARMLLKRDLDSRSMGVLLFAALLMFASWFRYMLMVDFGSNLQGRLFLPIAPVVGIIAVAGLQLWLKGRAKSAVAVVVYGGMVTANFLILRCIAAYYASGLGG